MLREPEMDLGERARGEGEGELASLSRREVSRPESISPQDRSLVQRRVRWPSALRIE